MPTASSINRAADPSLTMNTYTQLGIHDLAGALDRLPSVTGTEPERVRMRATGTDAARAEAPRNPRPKPRQLARDSMESEKATGRTRTANLRFTKPLLYQLSYSGKTSPVSDCQADRRTRPTSQTLLSRRPYRSDRRSMKL